MNELRLIAHYMNKLNCILLILIVVNLVFISGCSPARPGIRNFVSVLGKEIKMLVCKEKYTPANPCGSRDVLLSADNLRTVYLDIYGVKDDEEIESIISAVNSIREKNNKSTIPVVITFYSELRELNSFKAMIGPKVVYKITLEGEK